MELYAVWTEGEPREFIVTYNANGGKNAPEADTKIERETMQLSTEVPTKTGYLFKGWSKSSSGDVDYLPGADYSEDKNIVLFAVWEEGEIRVELSVSPGDAGEAVGGGAKEAGRIVYVTAVAKPGYVFSKWTVDASSTNVNLENIYAETTKFTMPNGTVSLTANFKQTEYDYVIRYDANGGSGAPNTQYKKHDENINISTTIPHRSGYTFEGWSDTLSNKTVKYVSGAEFSENRNVTLYAVWTKNTEEFTLKFDANGGTNPPVSITKTKDTIISIPSESPDNGTLIFLGWSEDKDADVPSYKKNDSYTITQNQTLYAVWSDKENPVIDITITEENRNLVLFGNAVDNG